MLKSFVGRAGSEFNTDHIDEDAWARLADKMTYISGDLTKPDLPWPTPARIPARSKLIWATRTSGIPCDTLNCRRRGSKASFQTDHHRSRPNLDHHRCFGNGRTARSIFEAILERMAHRASAMRTRRARN
jgi:hypothetical protein